MKEGGFDGRMEEWKEEGKEMYWDGDQGEDM